MIRQDHTDKKQILLVEGCNEQLTSLSGVLRDAGLAVTAARSIERVLLELQQGSFDVVCLDLDLEGGAGEAILCFFGSGLPAMSGVVIGITDGADEEKMQRVSKKVSVLLQRPFLPSRLLAEIRKIVESV